MGEENISQELRFKETRHYFIKEIYQPKLMSKKQKKSLDDSKLY